MSDRVDILAMFISANIIYFLKLLNQVNVMDTLSRLSHDTDSEVAMVKILYQAYVY